jgi:hypothetical protein
MSGIWAMYSNTRKYINSGGQRYPPWGPYSSEHAIDEVINQIWLAAAATTDGENENRFLRRNIPILVQNESGSISR